jgi:hypothetical protein
MGIAVWLLLLPLCYVLPSARVLDQLELARKKQPALHLTGQLAGSDRSWPPKVEVDLHPELGIRFDDGAGGRWVVRGGRPAASSRGDLPVWIPQLEPLILPGRAQLERWLVGAGIDWERNELGRCGNEDCFVLGGRDGESQLWLEKDRFEVRELRAPSGRRYVFQDYREFEGRRFPGKIAVIDGDQEIAVWTVLAVFEVPKLGPQDFSERWVNR